ncbi:PREDICTED: cyclin-dependent kinase [Prunus dulcis]|uniref:PREDICTED: cyclin-dependent kinase n=1 Tax=Prunus dulcis TaxID=3755 RepID=A0A5E4E447_PRUDU|nr:PREDICTED: cyclin-dependent kinase [Prunus dulcis]
MEVARVATSATAKKKRKVNTNGESVELPSSYAQLKKPRLLVVSGASKIAAAEGVREADEDVSTSDHVETSCCSSNGSSELVHDGDIKFVDLKKESEQVGSWKYNSSRERFSNIHYIHSSNIYYCNSSPLILNSKFKN